ncbi:hypothetical protein A7X81_07590 [Campylobacter ornithocola]|uniref:Uncharacterized protein n=1 Tax=Campylobacter ornithocola TaxID=1848766 RepID=A0A6M8MHD1_9BACT|nr:hypothetical protein [Campylobacter ornithocola]OCX43097.1 hypothetical protein A7X81_07590 [Campylobacter ornithocola]QKF57000.1 molybdopterin-containing oxidoreductase I, DMSO/TMAO/BSO reductase family, monoheme c-type cytochrome [Campylobacter ornithocola]
MKKIILALTFLTNVLLAKDMFIFNEKVDLLDVTDKKAVGTIYEGSKVELIKEEGEYSLVKVKGEVVESNPKSLAYTKDGIYLLLTLNTKNASTEMEFLVKSKDLTDQEILAWDEIELTYYDTCTSCHAAHKPKEHLMEEWDAYLSAMQGFAKITDTEKDRILRFLQSHASNGPVKLD